MVGRLSTYEGPADAIDRMRGEFERLTDELRTMNGFEHADLLVDRDSGEAMTLTLWDSEEAAGETDKFADQSRASTIEATGVELIDRGAYTVVTRL